MFDILAIDTETTGLDPATCSVIEIGTSHPDPQRCVDSLIAYDGEIPTMAKSITLIEEEDLERMPSFEQGIAALGWMADRMDAAGKPWCWAAHTAEFDRQCLPGAPDRPWLCTYRLAKHLLPGLESYGLQYLRYHLKLKIRPKGYPHRARYDAEVCYHVGIALLEYAGRSGWDVSAPEYVVERANAPVLLASFPFGKHAGVPLPKVPRDYLRWILGEEARKPGSWHADTLFTARFYGE